MFRAIRARGRECGLFLGLIFVYFKKLKGKNRLAVYNANGVLIFDVALIALIPRGIRYSVILSVLLVAGMCCIAAGSAQGTRRYTINFIFNIKLLNR